MDEALQVLPVGPVLAVVSLVLLAVGLAVPPRGGFEPGEGRAVVPVPAGGSPLAGRVAGGVALVVAVVLVLLARRGGPEVDNAGSLLVAGLGLPLLVLLPALASPLLRRPAARGALLDARPAVPVAALLAAGLVLPARPADPAVVAVAVGGYALLLVAVALAAGPRAVAGADLLGLLARWTALGPRLVAWAPPRGAAVALALLLAGVVAERVERTAGWQEAARGRGASALLLLALAGLALLAVVLLRRGTPSGTPAAVLVPLLAGAVAGALLRRALISAQLLADLVRDGPQAVVTDPLGVAGGQALAVGLVVLGGAAALAVLARRCGPGTARLPGLGVVLVLALGLTRLVVEP